MLRRESGARRQGPRIGTPLGWSVLIIALLAGYLLAAGQSATGVTARMVRDINPGEPDSYPQSFAEVGGKLAFFANDGAFGYELWVSDGTASGTQRLSDIAPGDGDARYSEMTAVQGGIFFVVASFQGVTQLWRSDGTRAGTHLVKTFNVNLQTGGVSEMIAVDDMLFFVVLSYDPVNQRNSRALWRSDGSEAGTIVVADVTPSQLTDVNGTLFFVAADADKGTELWKSNGTPAGTEVVADINPGSGSSSPVQLTNVNGTLFFVANDGGFASGRELWKSDGTAAGTVQIKDIYPGDSSSTPTNLIAVGEALFFTAYHPESGRELWRSDGTAASTTLVRDIIPGVRSSALVNLNDLDGTLFFITGAVSYDPFPSPVFLWRSDGTAEGTFILKDLNAVNYSRPTEAPFELNDRPQQRSPVDSKVDVVQTNGAVFIRYDYALWRSDGSINGTQLIYGLPYLSEYGSGGALLGAGDLLFFSNSDAVHGTELWTLPTDPKLYVRFLHYLPAIRDARPTPTFGYPDEPYPLPDFPTISPNATATMTATPQQ